jgi:hypothetical protein
MIRPDKSIIKNHLAESNEGGFQLRTIGWHLKHSAPETFVGFLPLSTTQVVAVCCQTATIVALAVGRKMFLTAHALQAILKCR